MIHSCVQETDQLIVAALQYLYWASFKQASSESITRRRFQQQQILYFIYTIIFVENSMGHPRRRTLAPKKSCISSRAPKTSLDPGKEATTHCWAEQSAKPCLEHCVGTGPQLTAGEVSRRPHKYEPIVLWGLQRTKRFTGDVDPHLTLFFFCPP